MFMKRISWGKTKNIEECISLLILMHPHALFVVLRLSETWLLSLLLWFKGAGCWHHPPSEWTACVIFIWLYIVIIPHWRRAIMDTPNSVFAHDPWTAPPNGRNVLSGLYYYRKNICTADGVTKKHTVPIKSFGGFSCLLHLHHWITVDLMFLFYFCYWSDV